MNLEAATFDSRFGGDVGERFKEHDELRPAIGIAAVIDRVDAEKNVSCAFHLGPGKRVGEKDGVPCRHVSDRDAMADLFLRTLISFFGSTESRPTGASGYSARTLSAMPPRAENCAVTIASRGAQALTKASKIRFVTASLNARSPR